MRIRTGAHVGERRRIARQNPRFPPRERAAIRFRREPRHIPPFPDGNAMAARSRRFPFRRFRSGEFVAYLSVFPEDLSVFESFPEVFKAYQPSMILSPHLFPLSFEHLL